MFNPLSLAKQFALASNTTPTNANAELMMSSSSLNGAKRFFHP